jgi:hypothetical protein
MVRLVYSVLFLGFSLLHSLAFADLKGCQYNEVIGNVVTHWNGGFSHNALETPPLFARRENGVFYTWGPQFLPNYNNYLTQDYTVGRVSDQKVHQTLLKFCESADQTPFRFVSPQVGDILGNLQTNSGKVQIIHGLIVDGSYVSVMLPPNWNPYSNTRYPVLFQGFYDVTDNVFNGFGEAALIARLVAKSSQNGNRGAIGVIWNGGASVSSVTANDRAYRQFNEILQLLAFYAKASPEEVILFGGSRGGVATLNMASNPFNYPYTVKFAVASFPGVKLGTHADLISSSMPAQLGGLANTGFADAWRPGWRYPSTGPHRNLWNMTAIDAMKQILFGTTDSAFIDNNMSPNSDRFVSRLIAEGTQLVLQFGSHDPYIPFGTEIEYAQKLRRLGASIETHIVMRGGHSEIPGLTESKVTNALLGLVGTSAFSAGLKVEKGAVYYYSIDQSTNQPKSLQLPLGTIPFSVDLPKVLYRGMPIVVMTVGTPGTRFWIDTHLGTVAGEIPNDGTYMNVQRFDSSGFSGEIVYHSIRIQKPGSSTIEYLNLWNTPSKTPEKLTTNVLPAPDRDYTGDELYNQRLKNSNCRDGWCAVSWGVAEY